MDQDFLWEAPDPGLRPLIMEPSVDDQSARSSRLVQSALFGFTS